MNRDFLGELTRDSEDGVITLVYEGDAIDVRIISDGQPSKMALQLATEVIEQLPQYDDARLFWGHALWVQSLNSNDFSTAHAELLG